MPAAKCAPGLASGISWDHSDPAYLQAITAVSWQNCKKAIRKVVLEWRSIDGQGGLRTSGRETLTADIVHKPSGKQTYSHAHFVTAGISFSDTKYENSLKSCTQYVDGRTVTLNKGFTFYTVATAYDKHGRKILQKVSPPVACDQNG